ncbi:MAG TPA: hypothetical protein VFU15_08015 [Bacteroidia bacterium]|nr:hypothetical protein [Bacteroidia bacterium]
MKKDIEIPVVEDVAIAVILEDDNGENVWNVYIVNMKDVPIRNVLVTSKGYGEMDGAKRSTSTLRHFFTEIPANDFAKIEPIMDFTFGLSNEYWVSFYIGEQIYDKRYIFLPESISEKNFTKVPLINIEGVMIR